MDDRGLEVHRIEDGSKRTNNTWKERQKWAKREPNKGKIEFECSTYIFDLAFYSHNRNVVVWICIFVAPKPVSVNFFTLNIPWSVLFTVDHLFIFWLFLIYRQSVFASLHKPDQTHVHITLKSVIYPRLQNLSHSFRLTVRSAINVNDYSK